MALGGLRKAQFALHVKNKMLVCCLYLSLFPLASTESRAGFRHLLWVSQGEAHSAVLSAAVSSGSLQSRDRDNL